MDITISPDGFLNLINNQNGGALIDELNRELAKAVEAVLDHGGKSTITLKISMSRIPSMEKGMAIKHDVTAVHPKESRLDSAMFISDGNGLLMQPQEQGTLLLDKDTGEVVGLEKNDSNVTQLNKEKN